MQPPRDGAQGFDLCSLGVPESVYLHERTGGCLKLLSQLIWQAPIAAIDHGIEDITKACWRTSALAADRDSCSQRRGCAEDLFEGVCSLCGDQDPRSAAVRPLPVLSVPHLRG
ncbi:hypothetical protein [Streptomyces sp. NPDC059649]|uniref:hypothetical protein n=1 Tax=Streptomyces sp. NPDC059649 TaxID=3346895 RepID=UPI0036C87F01